MFLLRLYLEANFNGESGLSMKIRKVGLFAAAALSASALVAGSIAPAYAVEENTVTIWTDKTRAEATKPTLTKFATKSGLTIKFVEKDFGTLRDAVIAAIPQGTGPDIIIGPHDWTGELVAAGVVSTVNLGANASKLNKGAAGGFASAGKQYGVPMYIENIAIVRNVKKAKTAPKTWAELTKNGALQIQSWDPNGDAYHFQALLSSFGISEYTRDSSGAWTKKVNLGGAAGDNYAKFLATLGKQISGPKRTWDQLRCDLADPASKVKYWLSGPWAIGNLTELPTACKGKELTEADIAIDIIPSAGGKTASQFLGANGAFQSVKVASQENAVAVGKVLTYLGTAPAQLDIFSEKNFTPAHSQALAGAAAIDKFVKGFGAAGKNAVAMPAFAFQSSVFDKLGATERNILLGKSKDPVKDWRAMVAAIEKLVAAGK
ncbi:MAG: hypothetical protein RLZZ579_1218 [Actinomycetota bacterium]|jgi:arabinogalactan oligomer/maltooligosaccharide transport system substrate-binding protein